MRAMSREEPGLICFLIRNSGLAGVGRGSKFLPTLVTPCLTPNNHVTFLSYFPSYLRSLLAHNAFPPQPTVWVHPYTLQYTSQAVVTSYSGQ